MPQVEVNSLQGYINCITALNKEPEYDEYFRRKVLLFRGQSNKNYELKPSLARYKSGMEDLWFVERNMIEMAKYKMPQAFADDMKPLELLSLLQHYGIPTRLLDLTENALVALYFACVSGKSTDGEVFVFMDLEDDVVSYPIVNAVADSYRFSKGSFCPLSLFYEDVTQQPYFLEQKNANRIIHKDSKSGGRWVEECCSKPFFVYAPYVATRQKNQSGRYMLFPNKINHQETESYFASKIEALSKEHECIKLRIMVKADAKTEIMKDLRILGISRESLFADSMDIVCEEIKNRFFM